MSSAAVVNSIKDSFENAVAYFKLIGLYFKKHNPIQETKAAIMQSVKDVMTANKRMKVGRYRVNHYKYRLYQMEKLINDNNPYNYKGSSFNQLR